MHENVISEKSIFWDLAVQGSVLENFRVSNMKKSKSTDFLKNAGIRVIIDFKLDLKCLKF